MWRTKGLIRGGPKYLFWVTVFSIFFTEIVVMTILAKFNAPSIPWYITAAIDASLLTLLLVPELYLFVLTPLKNNIRETEIVRDLLKTANDRLEEKVAERTAQLMKLNQLLEEEYVEALALSEQKYKGVIEGLAVGVTVINPNMELLSVNQKAASRCSGVDFSLKPICYEVFPTPPKNQPCEGCPVVKVLADGGVHKVIRELNEDGQVRIRRSVASPIRDSSGQITAVVNLTEDVTEQKQAEKAIVELNKDLEEMVENRTRQLREAYLQLEEKVTELEEAEQRAVESRNFYLTLFNEFPALIWRSGIDTKFDYFNQTWLNFTGRTLEEEMGHGWLAGIHQDDLDRCTKEYMDAFHARQPYSMDYRLRRHDGEYRWVVDRANPYFNADGHFAGYIGSCYDVTEQKIADALRIQSEERYRSLIRQSSEGIFILVPETKTIQEANNQFTRLLGYTEAEIIGKTLGEIVEETPEIIEKNVRRLIRGGETKLGHRKYKRKDGSLVDVEVSASLISFGTSAVGLVNVHDITERIKAEEHQRKSVESLRQTLYETVNAFITVTEKRDPYTAGHQHRVAQLAAAIGQELGLDEARAKGLEVAAKLHDLGKVYVPADILNKPGLLSAVEMALIKVHPVVGEEILGKIPFETPVGEIIAQHHERLDGSGYPKGLTADQIRLEAKILAVADTVEAMASHRPYRPALGLTKAFHELEKNKGTVFDSLVVETCLKVFHKGFEFIEGQHTE